MGEWKTHEFDIFIDDVLVKSVNNTGKYRISEFKTETYDIPAEVLKGKQQVRVKFVAKPRKQIGEIYEVRLVSPDPATTVKAEEKTVVKAEDKKVAEDKAADKTVKAETEKPSTMTGTVTKTDKGTTITLNNGKCKAFLPNGSNVQCVLSKMVCAVSISDVQDIP